MRVGSPLVSLLLALAACHEPAGSGCPRPLAGRIAEDAPLRHLSALAEIAAAHGGNRAAGTPGYRASADYVAARLADAGLAVRREPFLFTAFELTDAPRFAELAPAAVEHAFEDAFRVATYSSSGDVAAPLVAVDLSLGPDNDATSGCDDGDFAGFPAGAVALIQRGGCDYADKLARAAAAGAAAVVFFNQGDTDQRRGLVTPRLDPGAELPAIGVAYELGEALAGRAGDGLEVRVVVAAVTEERATENVLAETPATDSGRVVMLGAHLDSVPEGPGINDNGSGSAALLALAEAMPGCAWRHQVRLAFWGAEELGLLGSERHVAALSAAERAAIDVYLNFDMIGSPNPTRFVYDGDGSSFGREGPPGSAEIEAELAAYFTGMGLPFAETPFDGRSDYGPFIARNIAAGGLFTGANAVKSEAEAAVFGGAAGAAYDPCYHQACDDLGNVDRAELLINARAIGRVTEVLATREPPSGMSSGTGGTAD